MPCGWEGNRRSVVALDMRHRLQQFIHLRAHGLRQEDEQSTYAPHEVYSTFILQPSGVNVLHSLIQLSSLADR